VIKDSSDDEDYEREDDELNLGLDGNMEDV
jgi:hypothetical protein